MTWFVQHIATIAVSAVVLAAAVVAVVLLIKKPGGGCGGPSACGTCPYASNCTKRTKN